MNSPEQRTSTTVTVGNGLHDALASGPDSLEAAMASLRGHAAYATLGHIHGVATAHFNFSPSMEIALILLTKLPDVRVEVKDPLQNSCVIAPAYWKP